MTTASPALRQQRPRRRIGRALAVVAVTTLACAGLAELALRHWYPLDALFVELDDGQRVAAEHFARFLVEQGLL